MTPPGAYSDSDEEVFETRARPGSMNEIATADRTIDIGRWRRLSLAGGDQTVRAQRLSYLRRWVGIHGPLRLRLRLHDGGPSATANNGFPHGGRGRDGFQAASSIAVAGCPLSRAITLYRRTSVNTRCMPAGGSPAAPKQWRASRVAATRTPSEPTRGTRGTTTWDKSCGGLDPTISSYNRAPMATTSVSCSVC
jgi:hypothetical protein